MNSVGCSVISVMRKLCQGDFHLLDGVVKFDAVFYDFTFQMFRAFRMGRMRRLLCRDVLMECIVNDFRIIGVLLAGI